jgi:hypothetical protein
VATIATRYTYALYTSRGAGLESVTVAACLPGMLRAELGDEMLGVLGPKRTRELSIYEFARRIKLCPSTFVVCR